MMKNYGTELMGDSYTRIVVLSSVYLEFLIMKY